jgi:hypothetical protein
MQAGHEGQAPMAVVAAAGVRQQHVEAHHIHRQAGRDLVAAPAVGRFTHTAVVMQQGLGAGLGDSFELRLPGSASVERGLQLAGAQGHGQVAGGLGAQQWRVSGQASNSTNGSRTSRCDGDGLLAHQQDVSCTVGDRELVADAQQQHSSLQRHRGHES